MFWEAFEYGFALTLGIGLSVFGMFVVFAMANKIWEFVFGGVERPPSKHDPYLDALVLRNTLTEDANVAIYQISEALDEIAKIER